MTYVESVSPRMSHKVPHVLVSVPVLLPLESATQAVMNLLVFVVLVFQHAQESVRMPFDLETVTPVVMPTLTFVENVSQSIPHLLQQQQLFGCVQENVRRPLPLVTVIQAVTSTLTYA